MALSTNPKNPLATTYVVQQIDEDEIHRLWKQDRLLTTRMGGVLPEQSEPTRFSCVLDVGSGTGGWLVETAKTYPAIAVLCGAEANQRLLAYACAQAQAQQVQDRVTFQRMDVLRRIDVPDQYFDLINQRLGASFLRIWEWRKLLQEYQRICRPGGIVRITEADLQVQSTSPALTQVFALVTMAFHHAGHLFTPDSRSVLQHLVPLLEHAQVRQIQSRSHVLEYRADAPGWAAFVETLRLSFQTILPFLRKWTRVPNSYHDLTQQAMTEIMHPDFVGHVDFLTVWGSWLPTSTVRPGWNRCSQGLRGGEPTITDTESR